MSKKFNVILADCPWQYRDKCTSGERGSAYKYPLIKLSDLIDISSRIKQITCEDSVLFLWTTTPVLSDAMKLMKVWGYKYKTKLVWNKVRFGMGSWFRIQTEDLLVGIRGNVKAFHLQERNIISQKSTKHSRKPEEFRGMVERATSNMPYKKRIELFASTPVKGWVCLGLKIDGKDIRVSLKEIARKVS